MFEEMSSKNLDPSVFTYSALATACSKGSQWAVAISVLDHMRSKAVLPDIFTYSALINTCGNNRLWERSLQLLTELRQQDISGKLLCACSI